MTYTKETQELLSRLGRGGRVHAHRHEVDKVLNTAREARIRSIKHRNMSTRGSGLCSTNIPSNAPEADKISHRPWNARDEDSKRLGREKRAKQNSVPVPKVGSGNLSSSSNNKNNPFAEGNYRSSRRPGAQIMEKMKREEETMRQQGPPFAQGKRLGCGNRELEKTKLQMCFQFKGGKALPEAGLPGQSHIQVPLNLIMRKPARKKHSNAATTAKAYEAHRRRLTNLHESFDEVMSEVQSTKRRLSNATGARVKANLLAEINALVVESKTVDDLIRAEQQKEANSQPKTNTSK